jgi:hypothetical protein
MPTVSRGPTVTIANGATVSNAIDLGEKAIVGIQLPSALTSTALTFTASDVIDGTYNPVTKIDGNAYSITVAAAKYIVISPVDLAGIRYLKLVAGSAEAAARDIILMLKAV